MSCGGAGGAYLEWARFRSRRLLLFLLAALRRDALDLGMLVGHRGNDEAALNLNLRSVTRGFCSRGRNPHPLHALLRVIAPRRDHPRLNDRSLLPQRRPRQNAGPTR
jgi:hypothetical protein